MDLAKIGKQIMVLSDLMDAAHGRKSIICPTSMAKPFAGPTPAAFMINLPGSILHNLMQKGIFIYKPSPKTRRIYGRKGKGKTNG